MENYPPNSKKNERTRRPIIAHKKRTAPKGVVQSALGDGVYDVVQYILHDILAPALKNMASDALVNMIDMSIFGEGQSRSKRRARRGGEVTSYGKFYSDGRDRTPRNRGSRYRFDEIIIAERADAEDVLQQLIEIAEEYDAVTVADFYEIVGMTADYTKHGVGWRTLSRATIVRVNGGFIIDLPEPVNLD